MRSVELTVLAVLLGLYGIFFVLLLMAACVRGGLWQRRRERSADLVPRIHELFIRYLAGNNDLAALRPAAAEHRADFESALMMLQTTIGGGARDRLCSLLLELGLVHQWCEDSRSGNLSTRRRAFSRLAFACYHEPCRRVAGDLLVRALENADREIALSATRAVIHAGDPLEIQQVFEFLIRQDLRSRILLHDELRPHAVALSQHPIPELLASGDRELVLSTLQTLAAWERALPLRHLDRLLESDDRDIRLAALRLAPFVPLSRQNREAIVRALSEPDADVSVTALVTAMRLHLEESLQHAPRLLQAAPAEVTRVVAEGLADLPAGAALLRQMEAAPDSIAASAARHALSRCPAGEGE